MVYSRYLLTVTAILQRPLVRLEDLSNMNKVILNTSSVNKQKNMIGFKFTSFV